MNKNLLFLVVGCVALAAQTVKITNGEGPPVLESGERILQEKYHIAPTEEGLLGALQHRESEVRKLAAGTLAANGDKAAIRPILAALAAETVESNKIFLATAAAELGSAEGFNALKGMCDDRNWSPVQRMNLVVMIDSIALYGLTWPDVTLCGPMRGINVRVPRMGLSVNKNDLHLY